MTRPVSWQLARSLPLPPSLPYGESFPRNLTSLIDLRRLYREDGGGGGGGGGGGVVKVLCPFHNDVDTPNLQVYRDHAYCYACGTYEKAFDHIRRVCNISEERQVYAVALTIQAEQKDSRLGGGASSTKSDLDLSLVKEYVGMLDRKIGGREHLLKGYGLSIQTQEEAQLGYSEAAHAYTIPVFDLAGGVVNVRFRSDAPSPLVKYWGLSGRNGATLYLPPFALRGGGGLGERVKAFSGKTALLITEGEFDALALYSMGIAGVCVVGGVNVLSKENIKPLLSVLEPLRGHSLFLCFDQDGAGRQGAERAYFNLSMVGFSVGVLGWHPSLGKDVGELSSKGMSGDQFRGRVQMVQMVQMVQKAS